jgi:hypothetical protein
VATAVLMMIAVSPLSACDKTTAPTPPSQAVVDITCGSQHVCASLTNGMGDEQHPSTAVTVYVDGTPQPIQYWTGGDVKFEVFSGVFTLTSDAVGEWHGQFVDVAGVDGATYTAMAGAGDSAEVTANSSGFDLSLKHSGTPAYVTAIVASNDIGTP